MIFCLETIEKEGGAKHSVRRTNIAWRKRESTNEGWARSKTACDWSAAGEKSVM